MADFSFSVATNMMIRTAPFVIFRMIVYGGIALAYVLVTGVGAGIGWGIGGLGDEGFRAGATFWGGAIGFGATAAVLYFLREYILYLVKAGHIAVMVEYLDGRDLPAGQGQIEYAQQIVTDRFGQASVLFGIDQLVKGVVRAITRLVEGIASILPIPAVNGLMNFVRAFLQVAVGLIDEVILAYSMRIRADNPWQASRDALVLYGQNAKPMLLNAFWIALVSYGLSFLIFLVMLLPAGLVVWLLPGTFSAGTLIFALLFAWAAKAALIEPFALACLLQAYFSVVEGQQPNSDWVEKLDSASAKFGKLGERATGWNAGRT